MNDDEVNSISEPPYNHRNAYMLFYMRDSDSLEAAVAQATATSPAAPFKSSSSIGKKRAREDDDDEEDTGKPVRQDFLSSSGAGPSNPAGKKVSGMLPKQDRPPQLSHLAKPSLARPPHNRLPASDDEREELESPHFHKKAKLDVGVTFNGEGHRAEGKKKKKKKKLPQGNIIKLSSVNLSGKQPSLDLPNVSSDPDPDHEEGELDSSDPANTATILSTPPLPPSTPPTTDRPSPMKKRKLVDYSSEGENEPTDGDDATGDYHSKKHPAASPASSVSSLSDAMPPHRAPNPVFAPPSTSLSPQQRQQWNTAYRPKKQKYTSEHKQARKRRSPGNPYGLAGHPSGGSASSIGGSFRKRPGGI